MADKKVSTEDRLREAIESGEVLKVIYRGGSQPGTLREIAPISIKNNKVSARCYTSNANKSFALEKIVIVEGEVRPPAAGWQPELVRHEQYRSISQLLENQQSLLVQLGWHIEHDNNHLSLHRKFKTGKPLKSSDVALHYEEYTYDVVADKDGELRKENMRKRERPWTVRGKNRNTKTFSRLEGAAEVFMEWAKSLAPMLNDGGTKTSHSQLPSYNGRRELMQTRRRSGLKHNSQQ